MARKKRTHEVHHHKTDKEENTLHIEIDPVKAEHRSRRNDDIEHGRYSNRGAGGGAHGGSNKENNRRDRRRAKQEAQHSQAND